MEDKVKQTLEGLKDFQKATVDYTFDRMYSKGQYKMLIADEVGLGKTIIAKGIIAKGYQNFLDNPKGKKQFKAVYICSNQALSGQNIRKLNFLGDDVFLEQSINRLTYLSLKPDNNEQNFKISALTPGTSFDNKSSNGEAHERAIIFALLADYADFLPRQESLGMLLQGNKGKDWKSLIGAYLRNRKEWIRKEVFADFQKAINGHIITSLKEPKLFRHFGNKEVPVKKALIKACDQIAVSGQKFAQSPALISLLRRILAKICVKHLDADIFILDEFQRYNQLIKWEGEHQPPAVEMAKAVFSIPNAKILMLSATPFKAYTNDFDEMNGEVHYTEFRSVLRFLMDDKDEEFWKEYEENRRDFQRLILNSDNWLQNNTLIKIAKKKLETIYTGAMVRTERLLVSKDGNAMVDDVLKNASLSIKKEDVQDFINIDFLSKRIFDISNARLPIPVEYVKSTPYALSFLEGYQLKNKLSEEANKNAGLKKLVIKSGDLFVSETDIKNYKPIISQKASRLPNAKLRKVLENDQQGWQLLWVPPTLPYYDLQGAFKKSKYFSKTLIFSSWVMVPKMIAGIISYEAERNTVGTLLANNKARKKERLNYFDKPRSPKAQFTFKTINQGDAKQLSNFTLLYPCLTLANLYDPKENLTDYLSLAQVKKAIAKKVSKLLKENDIFKKYGTGGGDMDKWFWAAPILLDRINLSYKGVINDWFLANSSEEISIDTDSNENDKSEHAGRKVHFDTIKDFFFDENISLPKLDREKELRLINHLTEMVLGAPAINLYRSLTNYFGDKVSVVDAAYNISLSFLSLFNKPESIAIIRLSTPQRAYWQQVMEYCTDGNFQSMADEFIYLLYDCEGLRKIKDLQNYITDILTLKTSTIDIDSKASFLKKGKKISLRTHYAMDFGLQKKNITHGTNREVNLRQTFNSPFRPFVLASTSIGQEGLDFHLYCKKIVHWNLPSNPIDFEQREGRINRYKGLVIRQNVAGEYGQQLRESDQGQILWDHLFELAKESRKNSGASCDLIPFWHVEPEGGFHSKIERYVPLYPFSKDIEKYRQIQHVLTYYRLTFGQPRQDDLIRTFKRDLDKKDFEELMINLCPLLFN